MSLYQVRRLKMIRIQFIFNKLGTNERGKEEGVERGIGIMSNRQNEARYGRCYTLRSLFVDAKLITGAEAWVGRYTMNWEVEQTYGLVSAP